MKNYNENDYTVADSKVLVLFYLNEVIKLDDHSFMEIIVSVQKELLNGIKSNDIDFRTLLIKFFERSAGICPLKL